MTLIVKQEVKAKIGKWDHIRLKKRLHNQRNGQQSEIRKQLF